MPFSMLTCLPHTFVHTKVHVANSSLALPQAGGKRVLFFYIHQGTKLINEAPLGRTVELGSEQQRWKVGVGRSRLSWSP